jgi:hypothetical protein
MSISRLRGSSVSLSTFGVPRTPTLQPLSSRSKSEDWEDVEYGPAGELLRPPSTAASNQQPEPEPEPGPEPEPEPEPEQRLQSTPEPLQNVRVAAPATTSISGVYDEVGHSTQRPSPQPPPPEGVPPSSTRNSSDGLAMLDHYVVRQRHVWISPFLTPEEMETERARARPVLQVAGGTVHQLRSKKDGWEISWSSR